MLPFRFRGATPDRGNEAIEGIRMAEQQARYLAEDVVTGTVDSLVELWGDDVRERATEGVRQVANAWREADGDAEAFVDFVTARFAGEKEKRLELLGRVEDTWYQLYGHLGQMRRMMARWRDLDAYEDPGIDDLLYAFTPAPDLSEELYRSKLAFVVLLNFPRHTVGKKLADGAAWSPGKWAAVRTADKVPRRIPKEVNDKARDVHTRAQKFTAEFHVPVGCVVDPEGRRPFAPDRKLLAHWLIRDELRSYYGNADGLPRQRLLARIMGRHVDGTLPRTVMAGDAQNWCPVTNQIDGREPAELVGAERYAVWRNTFELAREFDPYYPDYPRLPERALEMNLQMPVERVESLLRNLLGSEVRREAMAYVERRLDRPLEAFDIYYSDLMPPQPAEELDAAVTKRFPTFEAFQEQMPDVLGELGFDSETAAFLSARIQVDPVRGCGHASPSGLFEYPALLRTNRVDGRINWAGLDCTMHELGHTVEQVFTLNRTPRVALKGIPHTSISEAFAFTFQARARDVVGLTLPPGFEQVDMLKEFLGAVEIAGPALVDLLTWQWMYDTPGFTATELRDFTVATADAVWTKYFEAYFGPDENHLMGAYQHMVGGMLYLPNYVVGHVVAHQIREHLEGKSLAQEVERMCSQGNTSVPLWMREAVGSEVDENTMIEDVRRALPGLSD
jgi:hypothetical protein